MREGELKMKAKRNGKWTCGAGMQFLGAGTETTAEQEMSAWLLVALLYLNEQCGPLAAVLIVWK